MKLLKIKTTYNNIRYVPIDKIDAIYPYTDEDGTNCCIVVNGCVYMLRENFEEVKLRLGNKGIKLDIIDLEA